MVAVALILLGIVILFTVAVVVSNPVPLDLSIFGAHIPVQTPAVFFAGAGTMLVAIVALLLLRTGMRRSMARRKEVRTLRKEAKAQGKRGTDGTAAVTTGGTKNPGAGGSTPPASEAGRGETGNSRSDTGSAGRAGPAGQSGPARQTGSARQGPSSGETTAAERQAWLAEIDDITGGDDPKR